MKKALLITLAILMTGVAFARQRSFYDELGPAQRKTFAQDWLETGKAYFEAHDKRNAQACYEYANDLYPMGVAAEEARKLLKEQIGVSVSYSADSSFAFFVNRAKALTDKQFKINNYLMALEIRQDAEVLYQVAYLYWQINDKTQAGVYLKKAVAAGYSVDKVAAELKSLLN